MCAKRNRDGQHSMPLLTGAIPLGAWLGYRHTNWSQYVLSTSQSSRFWLLSYLGLFCMWGCCCCCCCFWFFVWILRWQSHLFTSRLLKGPWIEIPVFLLDVGNVTVSNPFVQSNKICFNQTNTGCIQCGLTEHIHHSGGHAIDLYTDRQTETEMHHSGRRAVYMFINLVSVYCDTSLQFIEICLV